MDWLVYVLNLFFIYISNRLQNTYIISYFSYFFLIFIRIFIHFCSLFYVLFVNYQKLAVGYTTAAFNMYVLTFLTNVVGMSKTDYGYIIFISELINAFFNLFMGVVTDTTVSHIGRRRVYVLISTFLVPLFYSLFFITIRGNRLVLWIYYFMMSLLFLVFQTMFSVGQVALSLDKDNQIQNQSEKTKYSCYYAFFFALGCMTGPGLTEYIIDNFYYNQDKLGYAFIGAVSGTIIVLCQIIFYLNSTEVAVHRRYSKWETMKYSFGVFKNRKYLFLLLIYSLSQYTVYSMTINYKMYVTYVIELHYFDILSFN